MSQRSSLSFPRDSSIVRDCNDVYKLFIVEKGKFFPIKIRIINGKESFRMDTHPVNMNININNLVQIIRPFPYHRFNKNLTPADVQKIQMNALIDIYKHIKLM